MSNKKLQDLAPMYRYAAYYLGQPVINAWFPEGHPERDAGWKLVGYHTGRPKCFALENADYSTNTDSIKFVLRRLESMTEEEMIGLIQSMLPANMEDKPKDEDYDLEMFYNDDGLMVDDDIAVGANVTCGFWDGQVGVKHCGSIIMFDEGEDVTRDMVVNMPFAFHYLLKCGFDLFSLIDEGLAIDKNKTHD